jgi:peptidoglycan/xylan/chitin deacetylase (PgdA/CDA1 family)
MIPVMPTAPATHGALVISLDFELAWGVRDVPGIEPYRRHLLGAREVVPRLLDLFAERGVAATWATVGFLFADGRDEALAFAPAERPAYADPRLDPYRPLEGRDPGERVGRSERDDPLHFAPSLVRRIAAAPGQELASHTFSHLTAMEAGVSYASFEADLHAAQAIARAHGGPLRSLVLPRHQVRADFLPAIAGAGFVAHRGPEPHRLARPRAGLDDPLTIRGARLLDAYLPLTGANTAAWPRPDAFGLVDVPESRFLRPALPRLRPLEPLRVGRVVGAMTAAARTGGICHVWWHPHNFGADPDANLANLRAILDAFERLRGEWGFASFTMGEIAARALGEENVTPSSGAALVRSPRVPTT